MPPLLILCLMLTWSASTAQSTAASTPCETQLAKAKRNAVELDANLDSAYNALLRTEIHLQRVLDGIPAQVRAGEVAGYRRGFGDGAGLVGLVAGGASVGALSSPGGALVGAAAGGVVAGGVMLYRKLFKRHRVRVTP